MLSIPPHTHAFRCRRPGPAPIYLASPPTVTGHVNTARTSYLGCALRTARLNDDCRPHPTTVAAAPHYPHTRPPDVPARLVYQRILVNTYRTSELCRPRGRARPPSAYCDRRAFALTRSGAGVDLPGFGHGRSDMSDREDDAPAARGALGGRAGRTADRHDEDRHRPWQKSDFPLTMLHLNAAVSSPMKTFPAISTAFSWCSASSFAGFLRAAPSPALLYPRQTLRSTTLKKMGAGSCRAHTWMALCEHDTNRRPVLDSAAFPRVHTRVRKIVRVCTFAGNTLRTPT